MAQFNPFKAPGPLRSCSDKQRLRDPLEVQDLLTESTRKAIITPDGELKLQSKNSGSQPGIELMKERYWGSDANDYQALFSKQLALEARHIGKHFPEFELRRADSVLIRHNWTVARSQQMFWIGSLKTHSGAEYVVAAVYPCDYPFGEIYAYVLEPFLPMTEHRFQDGHLCLYDHQGNGSKLAIRQPFLWRSLPLFPPIQENTDQNTCVSP